MKLIPMILVIVILLAGCSAGAENSTETSSDITETSIEQSPSQNTKTPIQSQEADNLPELPVRRVELNSNITNLNITLVEYKVIENIETARREQNQESLVHDKRLSKIARRHSFSMVKKDFYSHVDPHFGGPSRRMSASGYDCPNMYGENIHAVPYNATIEDWNNTYDLSTESGIARFIVDSWMHSPRHRSIMLEEEYDVIGVGIFVSKDGRIFVTAEFCG